MDKECEPQGSLKARGSFQFVVVDLEQSKPPQVLPPPIDISREDLYMAHFSKVIQNCQFTERFSTAGVTLIDLMDGNQHLHEIAVALAALDISRRGQSRKHLPSSSPHVVAFASYQRAVSCLQDKLGVTNAPQQDDVLWTTFLLGLFEV